MRPHRSTARRGLTFGRRRLGFVTVACILIFASAGVAQEEYKEPPFPEGRVSQPPPDTLMPQILAAIQGVAAPDLAALARALHIGKRPEDATTGAATQELLPIGDLDGDGVPEMLLKWPLPDDATSGEVAPAPDSSPLWSVYLLSWDGTHWRASRVATGIEQLVPSVINLGPSPGTCLALVTQEGDPQDIYPQVFQVKNHAAALLWDSQADDSRYQTLLQGRVSFENRRNAPAEMIVTGRADPGLLKVSPKGHRGFQARVIYRWDGKAFIPAKTEYTPGGDYTVYRFISALHLHDFASAYSEVVPGKFLQMDSPTVDAFRHFIESNWPEFLQDNVFDAPEPAAGSRDENIFVLHKADTVKVYHPDFSIDGKFLLTGLSSSREVAEP